MDQLTPEIGFAGVDVLERLGHEVEVPSGQTCCGQPAMNTGVQDLELIEMKETRSCCGFGATFAIKFPQISTAMTQVKTGSAEETGAEYLVSNDPSCMLQIQGTLEKQGSSLKCLHLAQVLAKTSSDG